MKFAIISLGYESLPPGLQSIETDVLAVILDHALLLLAVLLLCLPFPTLSKRFRVHSLLTRYSRPDLGAVTGNWKNWVDMLRGAVASYVAIEAILALSASLVEWEWIATWVALGVLLLGVTFQTFRLPTPITLVGPIFYLSGLTLVLPGYFEGAFAVLFGWIFAFSAKDLRFQLPAMGIALGLVGFFNESLNLLLLSNILLVCFPLLASLLSGKRLVFLTRETRGIRKAASVSLLGPKSNNGAAGAHPQPASRLAVKA